MCISLKMKNKKKHVLILGGSSDIGLEVVKKFLQTGGLRCEILSSGKIHVGDIIKIL